ncbi:MAG: leucine-rich repeat domain-containing protein [Clostridia bacterium]|nr:leucine-rich repeat domain-containing protein [Clostridia bacterium]MBQ9710196.1 leucine-rich repeat domain-containing protein [Clostridia bacterium]
MSGAKDFIIKDGVLEQYVGNGGDVVIPNDVGEIGRSAFSGCSNILSITIPDSVYRISFSAFQGCRGLTEITIPASVFGIEDWAFECCKGLAHVTVLGKNTKISKWAFYECSEDLLFHVPKDSEAKKFVCRYFDEELWSDRSYNPH